MTDRNSIVFQDFKRDLIRYQRETGKTTNRVLADRALDFSIKLSKLLADEAPSKEEIDETAENLGYRITVRKRILKKLGVLTGNAVSYKGSYNRFRNKRSTAVRQELAVRRSSIKWLSRSIPKWKKSLNNSLTEKNVIFSRSYTRRRTSQVGETTGSFSKRRDRVLVSGFAAALEKVNKDKGNLAEKALEQSRRGFVDYLNRRVGRQYGKLIKRVYK